MVATHMTLGTELAQVHLRPDARVLLAHQADMAGCVEALGTNARTQLGKGGQQQIELAIGQLLFAVGGTQRQDLPAHTGSTVTHLGQQARHEMNGADLGAGQAEHALGHTRIKVRVCAQVLVEQLQHLLHPGQQAARQGGRAHADLAAREQLVVVVATQQGQRLGQGGLRQTQGLRRRGQATEALNGLEGSQVQQLGAALHRGAVV